MSKELTITPNLRKQVAEILSGEIKRSAFPSKRLPSVRVLSKRFGVSTLTIVGALEILEAQKLIERVHGKGVFIRDKRGRSPKLGARLRQIGVFCYTPLELLAEDTYYSEVLAGMVESAGRAGDRLTFVTLKEGDEVEQVRRALAEVRFDGGVLLAWTQRESLLQIQRLEIPFVLADHDFEGLRMDCVSLDSRQASIDAVRHLYGLGHRNIGLLASRAYEHNIDRYEGFFEGLAAVGLDPKRAVVRKQFSDYGGGYTAMREWIAEGKPRSCAFMVWSGPMTAGAIQALRESNLTVPRDVSLVAACSQTFARFYPDVPATIADGGRLGAKVIELLDRRIADPETPYETVQLPMPLEPRASLGEASRPAGKPT